MTTFAPESAVNPNTRQPEIRFQEGVGIILGSAALESLFSVLPQEEGEVLFTLAVESSVVSELRVTFSQARALADALRPPEDTSWQNHGLTDEQLFAGWDFDKTTQLHGRLRQGLSEDLEQSVLPLYRRESQSEIAAKARKQELYEDISSAVHALAAAAIANTTAASMVDDIAILYDAYPLVPAPNFHEVGQVQVA